MTEWTELNDKHTYREDEQEQASLRTNQGSLEHLIERTFQRLVLQEKIAC